MFFHSDSNRTKNYFPCIRDEYIMRIHYRIGLYLKHPDQAIQNESDSTGKPTVRDFNYKHVASLTIIETIRFDSCRNYLSYQVTIKLLFPTVARLHRGTQRHLEHFYLNNIFCHRNGDPWEKLYNFTKLSLHLGDAVDP